MFAIASPAAAQDDEAERYRITAGPHAYPSYPGSDSFEIGPLVNFDRAKGDTPFTFEAPDQAFGFTLVDSGGFSFGPIANIEGKRDSEDVGTVVPEVDISFEPGVFIGIDLTNNFRLRGEVRKGISGHKGWIGVAMADFVARDGDKWLFSIGPRVTWTDNRYQDAWFSVAPADAPAAGLPAYNAGGGIQAYGVTSSFLRQVSAHWGFYGYAKYDRLVGDPADSPLVRAFGSRDQVTGGLGLMYTFGRNVGAGS